MKVYIGRSRATDADVAALCTAASLRIGAITRSMHQTDARPRTGRHSKLSPEEKERRKADRLDRQRKRRRKQETLAEMAEQRAARKRQRNEDQWWKTRIRVKVPKEERSKVTRSGGRNVYRQRDRFENVVLPQWKASSFQQTALVWRIKSRSLGGKGRNRYRRRECARFGRYLTNIAALEAAPDRAILTSIVPLDVRRDSDEFARELATFLSAAEDLETQIDANGQFYKSIIIPLPHDIGFERRREIAQSYARQFDRHNLPYVIAMHAPDPGGDQRNYHLHALVLTRAFERIGDHEWTFAKTKSRDVFHPAMLKVWRRYTANLFNHHLSAIGSDRRYSLRAAKPTAEHQGRVRTIEQRQAANAAAEHVEQAEERRVRSGLLMECAKMIAVVANRHVETGRMIDRTGRVMLDELKARLAATRTQPAAGRRALQHAALLAEVRRLAMAASARKQRLVRLGRSIELRRMLSDLAAHRSLGLDRVNDASRVMARRLSTELGEMSAKLQTDRTRLRTASLQASQRQSTARIQSLTNDMSEDLAQGRRDLEATVGGVAKRIRYTISHMSSGMARRRAALRSIEQAGVRQRASALQDRIALIRDGIAFQRSSLPLRPRTGVGAQAAALAANAKADPKMGPAQSKGLPAALPDPASSVRRDGNER